MGSRCTRHAQRAKAAESSSETKRKQVSDEEKKEDGEEEAVTGCTRPTIAGGWTGWSYGHELAVCGPLECVV